MLRNLKEIYTAQRDWPRLVAVLERLVVLLPGALDEVRDRGLAHAEAGHTQLAVADLENYLQLGEDILDGAAIHERLAVLRRATS
jgi:regulator of sirC expression with transglutaminase-like and TPR domain